MRCRAIFKTNTRQPAIEEPRTAAIRRIQGDQPAESTASISVSPQLESRRHSLETGTHLDTVHSRAQVLPDRRGRRLEERTHASFGSSRRVRYTHLARHLLDELADSPLLHYLTNRSRARRCLSVAASVGGLELMEHLVELFRVLFRRPGLCERPPREAAWRRWSGCTAAAASNGQLELLQWMHANSGDGCTAKATDHAAMNGHLDTVQWLHSKGLQGSPFVTDCATRYGHLSVVKFPHNDLFGHQSSAGSVVESVPIDKAACTSSLAIHVEVLKWLQTNGIRAVSSVSAMNGAATTGRLDVVQFLHKNRDEGCTTKAMDHAGMNGYLEAVKFLLLTPRYQKSW